MQNKQTYLPALWRYSCGLAVIRNRRGVSYQIQCATSKEEVSEEACNPRFESLRFRQSNLPNTHPVNGALINGAAGYRNRTSGALTNMGSNGNYWSCSPNSQTNARNLNFNSSNVNPLNNNNRANGFSVRPAEHLGGAGRYVFIN